MSRHLHDDTSLYYITFFIERSINKTSSLLLKDTGYSPPKQYNYLMLVCAKDHYKYFNSHMQLVRQRFRGSINSNHP